MRGKRVVITDVSQLIERRRRLWEREGNAERDRAFCEVAARTICAIRELKRQVRREPWLLIEACFTVVDKGGHTVPFFFNEVQRDFIRQLREHGTSRPYNILKGRQQGFTTVVGGLQLSYSISRRNFFSFTLADCTDNVRSIFNDKARSLYDRLPDILKPHEKFNSAKELFFDKLNSSWRVATATRDVARSKTLHFVHYSEAAFYKCRLSELQASVGNALVSDALIIYETTANGFGEFKDLWDGGTCVNLFYPWWRTAEYRSTAYDFLENTDEWLTRRLSWLKDEIGLDREQLCWYAEKYASYLDKRMIRQEYPCTPEEAFLTTGESVFDVEKLSEQMVRVSKLRPLRVGYFDYRIVHEAIRGAKGEIEGTRPRLCDIRWVDDPNGCIRIHAEPRKLLDERTGQVRAVAPYVIGGDTAGEGSDYFTAKVICNLDGSRAATLRRQRMDEDKYAEQIYCLGKYYHDALVGIETNYSRTPTRRLLTLSYPKMYNREVMTGRADEVTEIPGFETNRATRPIILDALIGEMRDAPWRECDMETLREMSVFIRHKNGKQAAMVGEHDDLVMASAIASHICARQKRTWMELPRAENDFIKKNFKQNTSPGGAFMDWED